MSRPNWLLTFIKAVFPRNPKHGRITHLPGLGNWLEKKFFEGDHNVTLPRAETVQINHTLGESEQTVLPTDRAIPAERDFNVGSTLILKGSAAALHVVHKGYIGRHHFFTNEECWYLGPDYEYRGDDLPFGNFATIDIEEKLPYWKTGRDLLCRKSLSDQ